MLKKLHIAACVGIACLSLVATTYGQSNSDWPEKGSRRGPPSADHIFERIDADEDGSISRDEFRNAHEKMQQRRRESVSERFPRERVRRNRGPRGQRGFESRASRQRPGGPELREERFHHSRRFEHGPRKDVDGRRHESRQGPRRRFHGPDRPRGWHDESPRMRRHHGPKRRHGDEQRRDSRGERTRRDGPEQESDNQEAGSGSVTP